jgi:hypothetical protein
LNLTGPWSARHRLLDAKGVPSTLLYTELYLTITRDGFEVADHSFILCLKHPSVLPILPGHILLSTVSTVSRLSQRPIPLSQPIQRTWIPAHPHILGPIDHTSGGLVRRLQRRRTLDGTVSSTQDRLPQIPQTVRPVVVVAVVEANLTTFACVLHDLAD